MKKALLLTCLLVGMWLKPAPAWAQASAAATSGIPWFSVHNKVLVVQTGSKIKPLTKDVTLPNGLRIEYRTQSILLTNGSRVQMEEGDLLSLNGEFIRKPPAPETAPALP